jgi:hypothetical protein
MASSLVRKEMVLMRRERLVIWALVILGLSGLFFSAGCREKSASPPPRAWLDSLFEQGRAAFFQTIRDEISTHPERGRLTATELLKIQEAETRYGRLYGILINVFYQKDEPVFTGLLEKGDKKSLSRFSGMYLDLARFAGHMFVRTFFDSEFGTDLLRKTHPAYKDLDAADLVVRSVGYHAKLDAPPTREFF